MIRIHIVRDKSGLVREFTVKGHAGFGEHGEDIVCSAVSAIAYTAVGALEDIAGVKGHSEKNGYMKCSLPLELSEDSCFKAKIILDAMTIGFKQVEMAYSKYVSVLDEEV